MSIEPKVEDLLASIRKAIDNDLGEPGSSTAGQSRGTLMRGALREMRVNLNDHERRSKTADTEIAELRSRILRSATEVPPMPPPPRRPARPAIEPPAPSVPSRSDFRGIMSSPPRDKGMSAPPSLPPPSAKLPFRPAVIDDDPYLDTSYAAPPPESPYQDPYEEQAPHQDYGYEQQQPYDAGYDGQRDVGRGGPPQGPTMMSAQSEAAAQMAFRQLSEALLSRTSGDRTLEDLTRELLRGMLKQWLDDNLPRLVERLVREEIARVARRGR